MILKYSRGYTSTVASTVATKDTIDTSIEKDGDAQLASFVREVNDGRISLTNWTGISELLDIAIRLIGSPSKWIHEQAFNNKFIGDHGVEFIADTLGYLITGKRFLTHDNWLQLHLINSDTRRSTTKNLNGNFYKILTTKSDSDIYRAWIIHPDGVVDLYQTLQLCFGPEMVSEYDQDGGV